MRHGLVIYGNLETISGGYLYDRKLVEHLERQGDQVEIVSLPWRNYARHLGDNFRSTLMHRLRHLDVDVLLEDELNHPSLFRINRRLAGAFSIVSIVHHLRSSEYRPAWQNQIYRWVERSYLASVDGFIFNSQTTRQAVESLIETKKPCVVATPAGDRLSPRISDEEIARRAGQPGPLHLLFLGNVTARKGLHTLLEALSMLPKDSWKLSVAGRLDVDHAYVNSIRRRAAQRGLSAQVIFLGVLDDEALGSQLRSSQVLALPSSYEGFGIAYLEGMGFGLPAIATTGGAAGEIITDGIDGFLIKPGDILALRDCIRELAQDRQRLLKLSLAARKRYEVHPGWEDTGRSIRKIPGDNSGGVTLQDLTFSFSRYLEAKKSVDDRALNRLTWDALGKELTAARFPGPLRVLEVGAGIGTMLQRMVEWELVSNAEYTAIDLDPQNISSARQRLAAWASRSLQCIEGPHHGHLAPCCCGR